jgi:hypothetical protein
MHPPDVEPAGGVDEAVGDDEDEWDEHADGFHPSTVAPLPRPVAGGEPPLDVGGRARTPVFGDAPACPEASGVDL